MRNGPGLIFGFLEKITGTIRYLVTLVKGNCQCKVSLLNLYPGGSVEFPDWRIPVDSPRFHEKVIFNGLIYYGKQRKSVVLD